MRVRCPKCSSVNEHPDELGWRKTECPVCFHPFVATRVLAVTSEDPAEKVEAGPRPAGQPPGRAVPRTMVIAAVGLALLGAGFLARLWLAARSELQELRQELDEIAAEDAPADGGPAAERAGGDATRAEADEVANVRLKVGKLREKMEDARLLASLQAAAIGELESRVRTLEAKVKRAENALAREKDAHGETKGKISDFLKENMVLRRQMDALLREIYALEKRLERGR